MKDDEFRSRVKSLRGSILEAIHMHFREQQCPFDEVKFLAESRRNMGELAKDAYFFGAEIYPDSHDPDAETRPL